MSESFRLMTANLLHVRADPVDFERLLDEVQPDILVTQELGPACARVVEKHYPNHRLDPAPGFTGRGVATRFPAEFGDIDMPVRNGTWAFVDVQGQLLRLVGMHLVNPIEFPWWSSVLNRRRQLEALFAWTGLSDPDIPLVVAGDMNASPRWPAYKQMADRWDDLVARSVENPERTWAWRPGWPRMLRIDHIFGTRITATGVMVQPIEGSDHHAVIADLRFA